MSRNSEDTVVYTDNLTVTVIEAPEVVEEIVVEEVAVVVTETLSDSVASTVISEPTLQIEPSSLYKFTVGEPVEINFGSPAALYTESIQTEVSLGTAASFLYLDDTTIKTRGVSTEDMIGTYKISIKLSVTINNNDLEKTYKLQLQINKPDLEEQNNEDDSETADSNEIQD